MGLIWIIRSVCQQGEEPTVFYVGGVDGDAAFFGRAAI